MFVSHAEKGKGIGLTLRQREVLQLLAEGKSMKEAADILNVTPRTIAFHKYSMMEHLGFKTTAQLIQHAVALGLVGGGRQRDHKSARRSNRGIQAGFPTSTCQFRQ